MTTQPNPLYTNLPWHEFPGGRVHVASNHMSSAYCIDVTDTQGKELWTNRMYLPLETTTSMAKDLAVLLRMLVKAEKGPHD